MEQDSQRAGISSEDDQFADTTVQSLGGLVGTLLELAVVGGLLDEIWSKVSYQPCEILRPHEVGSDESKRRQNIPRISWDRAWSAWGQAAELSSAIFRSV